MRAAAVRRSPAGDDNSPRKVQNVHTATRVLNVERKATTSLRRPAASADLRACCVQQAPIRFVHRTRSADEQRKRIDAPGAQTESVEVSVEVLVDELIDKRPRRLGCAGEPQKPRRRMLVVECACGY